MSFVVIPENLCRPTCLSWEATHSFKLRPTLSHYVFGDATKSTDCLQLLAGVILDHVKSRKRPEMLSVGMCTKTVGSKLH